MKTTIVAGLSLVASGVSLQALAQSVGVGLYDHAGQIAEERFGGPSTFGDRDFETRLTGELVTRPTTVRGLGGTTVVTRNVIINRGRVAEFNPTGTTEFLDAQCPLLGFGRVIIRDNKVINLGSITNHGGGSAATIAVTCSPFGYRDVDVIDNDLRNHGPISSE